MQASFPGSDSKEPNWDLNGDVDTSRNWYLGIILLCPQEIDSARRRDDESSFGYAGGFLAGSCDLRLHVKWVI